MQYYTLLNSSWQYSVTMLILKKKKRYPQSSNVLNASIQKQKRPNFINHDPPIGHTCMAHSIASADAKVFSPQYTNKSATNNDPNTLLISTFIIPRGRKTSETNPGKEKQITSSSQTTRKNPRPPPTDPSPTLPHRDSCRSIS